MDLKEVGLAELIMIFQGSLLFDILCESTLVVVRPVIIEPDFPRKSENKFRER